MPHDRAEVSEVFTAGAADVGATGAPPDPAGGDCDMCCERALLLYETGDVASRAKAENWWPAWWCGLPRRREPSPHVPSVTAIVPICPVEFAGASATR
jgi:hypothetical protein